MKTYESRQKQLNRSQQSAYDKLSNMNNLEAMINNIPSEHKGKIENIELSEDAIAFSVAPIGRVELKIIDREAPKMLKFGADKFPIPFSFWVQLQGVDENDTRMKLTLKADIPMMLKPMIGNKLDDGIERIADLIAMALNK